MSARMHTLISAAARLIPVLFFFLAPAAGHAATAAEIDARVDATIADFRKRVTGAEEYLASAKGVLVVPEVRKVGLIVGGQWGEGALRVGGKTVDYYKMGEGSVGFQAGYQKANFLFVFLTQESLDKFRSGKGWAAGMDAGVTIVDQSIGASADTLKAKAPVLAFIFGKEGLMGGVSLKGQKLTRFTPGK